MSFERRLQVLRCSGLAQEDTFGHNEPYVVVSVLERKCNGKDVDGHEVCCEEEEEEELFRSKVAAEESDSSSGDTTKEETKGKAAWRKAVCQLGTRTLSSSRNNTTESHEAPSVSYSLLLKVFDQDTGTSDDLIGQAAIEGPIPEYEGNEEGLFTGEEQMLPLYSKKNSDPTGAAATPVVCGYVFFRFLLPKAPHHEKEKEDEMAKQEEKDEEDDVVEQNDNEDDSSATPKKKEDEVDTREEEEAPRPASDKNDETSDDVVKEKEEKEPHSPQDPAPATAATTTDGGKSTSDGVPQSTTTATTTTKQTKNPTTAIKLFSLRFFSEHGKLKTQTEKQEVMERTDLICQLIDFQDSFSFVARLGDLEVAESVARAEHIEAAFYQSCQENILNGNFAPFLFARESPASTTTTKKRRKSLSSTARDGDEDGYQLDDDVEEGLASTKNSVAMSTQENGASTQQVEDNQQQHQLLLESLPHLSVSEHYAMLLLEQRHCELRDVLWPQFKQAYTALGRSFAEIYRRSHQLQLQTQRENLKTRNKEVQEAQLDLAHYTNSLVPAPIFLEDSPLYKMQQIPQPHTNKSTRSVSILSTPTSTTSSTIEFEDVRRRRRVLAKQRAEELRNTVCFDDRPAAMDVSYFDYSELQQQRKEQQRHEMANWGASPLVRPTKKKHPTRVRTSRSEPMRPESIGLSELASSPTRQRRVVKTQEELDAELVAQYKDTVQRKKQEERRMLLPSRGINNNSGVSSPQREQEPSERLNISQDHRKEEACPLREAPSLSASCTTRSPQAEETVIVVGSGDYHYASSQQCTPDQKVLLVDDCQQRHEPVLDDEEETLDDQGENLVNDVNHYRKQMLSPLRVGKRHPQFSTATSKFSKNLFNRLEDSNRQRAHEKQNQHRGCTTPGSSQREESLAEIDSMSFIATHSMGSFSYYSTSVTGSKMSHKRLMLDSTVAGGGGDLNGGPLISVESEK